MKNIFVKIVCVLFAFIMAFSAGCSNDSNNDSSNYKEEIAYNYDSGINKDGKVLNLVKNGQSEYTIVISDEATDREVKVASELQEAIIASSGAYLPIIRDKYYQEGTKVISLGNTQVYTNSGVDVSNLKDDGYTIKTVGDNVIINSNLNYGVQFGTYTFMERFLGIRWLTSTETYLPKNTDINVYECEITEEPNFAMRYYMNGTAYFANFAGNVFFDHLKFIDHTSEWWCGELGTNHNSSDGHSPGISKGYVNKYDVDPSDPEGRLLKDTHPEYFTDYTNTAAVTYDICFTNGINEDGTIKKDVQSVASLMVAKMKRALLNDTDRTVKYLMFGHSDYSNAICKCTTCEARRPVIKESGMYLMLANACIREVNEWLMEEQGRTVAMVIFAYHQSFLPPAVKNAQGEFEPINEYCLADENVHVRIAPINADYTYSFVDERQDEGQMNAIEGWEACADTFLIWDYVANFNWYYAYTPNLHYMKDNLKMYKERLNATYVMNQSQNAQARLVFSDLFAYVTSRLYWNFNWDVEYLVDEFLTLYFGPAKDTVKEIMMMLEEIHVEQRDNNDKFWAMYNAEYETADLQRKEELDKMATKLYQYQIMGGNFNNADVIPVYVVEKMINMLNYEMDKISKNADVDADNIYKRLERTKLYPMFIILNNYKDYYSRDTEIDFAIEFFALCDKYGYNNFGEGDPISDLKVSYGIK